MTKATLTQNFIKRYDIRYTGLCEQHWTET